MAATDQGGDASLRHLLRARAAFTLMELIVVISIITIFAGVIGFGFLRGSSSSTVGLQASQSIVVGLLTQARSQAILTGRTAGLLIHNDPAAGHLPDRYLRYLVPVVEVRNAEDTGWTWTPLDAGTFLSAGCVVVPDPALAGNWIDATGTAADWAGLRSSALALEDDAVAIESRIAQAWMVISFTSRGTVKDGSSGNIVVAAMTPQPAGSATHFKLTNPKHARGVAITEHGQARLINSSNAF